jgi:hypothetical protein
MMTGPASGALAAIYTVKAEGREAFSRRPLFGCSEAGLILQLCSGIVNAYEGL